MGTEVGAKATKRRDEEDGHGGAMGAALKVGMPAGAHGAGRHVRSQRGRVPGKEYTGCANGAGQRLPIGCDTRGASLGNGLRVAVLPNSCR